MSYDAKNVIGRSKCGSERCKWLADIIPELIFEDMCKKHDLAYFLGGPIELKDFADLIFYREMKQVIKKEAKWSRWFYYSLAWIYYKGVHIGGKSSWAVRDVTYTLHDVNREVEIYVQRKDASS